VKELDPLIFTKSGVMVGLGEEKREVAQVMDDMRSAEVDFLTVGQYLQPTPRHHKVERFVEPAEFEGLRPDRARQGLRHGLGLAADPLLAPRRRRLRPAAGREDGAAGPGRGARRGRLTSLDHADARREAAAAVRP
jgi:hypothetical protein